MTRKRKYLQALLSQPTSWIIKSAENPNEYMTQTDIKLHYIALRMRRA